jgi:hypothetical protein
MTTSDKVLVSIGVALLAGSIIVVHQALKGIKRLEKLQEKRLEIEEQRGTI